MKNNPGHRPPELRDTDQVRVRLNDGSEHVWRVGNAAQGIDWRHMDPNNPAWKFRIAEWEKA